MVRHATRAFDEALRTTHLGYQRVVNREGVVVGHAALLRSRAPGLELPAAGVAVGERLSRAQLVGRAVRVACAERLERDASATLLFLNLHPHDLDDMALQGDAEPLTCQAARVVLEVSERAPLNRDTPAQLKVLRRRGFRIAVADLGTSDAAIGNFALLDPEFVKLDVSLVRSVLRSDVARAVIERFARMCHQFDTGVIAERLATSDELRCARALGCDLFQGCLFG